MANEKVVLITGATGKQGGATLRHLREARRVQAARDDAQARQRAAKALASAGRRGGHRRSRRRRVAGARARPARGACSRSRTPGKPASRRKRSRASASRRSRATRASSTSCTRRSVRRTSKTGIPHFENKFRVEETVKQLRLSVARDPAPGVLHGEPARRRGSLNGDKLTTTLKPDDQAADDRRRRHRQVRRARRSPRPTSSRAPRSTSPVTRRRCPRPPPTLSELTRQDGDVRADPDRGGAPEQRGHRADARVVRRRRLLRRHRVAGIALGDPADHAQAVDARRRRA